MPTPPTKMEAPHSICLTNMRRTSSPACTRSAPQRSHATKRMRRGCAGIPQFWYRRRSSGNLRLPTTSNTGDWPRRLSATRSTGRFSSVWHTCAGGGSAEQQSDNVLRFIGVRRIQRRNANVFPHAELPTNALSARRRPRQSARREEVQSTTTSSANASTPATMNSGANASAIAPTTTPSSLPTLARLCSTASTWPVCCRSSIA